MKTAQVESGLPGMIAQTELVGQSDKTDPSELLVQPDKAAWIVVDQPDMAALPDPPE